MRSTFTVVLSLLLTAPIGAGAQAVSAAQRAAEDAYLGRWDLTIRTPEGTRPSWLEVKRSGHRTLVGQFVGPVGSARPVARVDVRGGAMRFAIPPQWEEGTNDVVVEGRVQGAELAGTIDFGDGRKLEWTGRRAPSLRRAAEPRWGEAVSLLESGSLAGWRVVGGESQWRVGNGVLSNARSGGNLVTERTFSDFRLHLEFRYPKGSNSGVYLRGRYEVQIADSAGVEPQNDLLGAIYGFVAPSELLAGQPGEWQSYDITLIGRRVTVVVNGRTVIADREIPGITGGALDSDEGAPGPLMLQGDHGPIEYRHITIATPR